ncbi:unnamed protein product [Caenorhabditis angaria]|uniref:Uncharacterized protein n=1 Tax=Caenorhabditis angaria TaxID=860376 RepID=A0A9P1IYY3_9PELO|nr:unnamed protein product [Caenorhabditis angaria]
MQHPVFPTLQKCQEECGSLVSGCIISIDANFECALNLYIFFLVIFLAIFTGLLIPISCLICWINGFFDKSSKKRRSIFLKNRGFRRAGTIGNDEERDSLYPSSPPNQTENTSQNQKRHLSTFSLPAQETVVTMNLDDVETQRRCRKITFDLSMTQQHHRRVDEFSQL